MKYKTCGSEMRLTKTLSFNTGPLRLVFECTGTVVHAAVHDMQQEDSDDLLLQATGNSSAPDRLPISKTTQLASR